MRALVFSDIHNNFEHVERLREREANDYDAVIVAGDIGDRILPAFVALMDSFDCPVYLVYGNWDRHCAYTLPETRHCVLLDHDVVAQDGLFFAGFGGCPAGWGQNALFRRALAEAGPEAAPALALELNRQALRKTVRRAGVPRDRLVVITHDRLTRLAEQGPAPLLHIHGHRHRHDFRRTQGIWYLNAAALDAGSSARRSGRTPEPEGYCVATIAPGRVEVERRLLWG